MKPNILLVDDDQNIQRLLLYRMNARYRVDSVGTIAGARAAVGKSKYDLILLDFHLPDGSATDFLRDGSPCPVILLTARGIVSPEMSEAFDHVLDYIAKPFTIDELFVRIDRIVHAKASRRWINDLERRVGRIDRLGREMIRGDRREMPSGAINFEAPAGWGAAGLLEEAWCLGGDILEQIRFKDGSTGYVISDVSGKGLAVAAVSGMLRASFFAVGADCEGPAELLDRVNARWRKWAPRKYLATALVISVSNTGNRFSWSSAGHPWPHARVSGKWATLEDSSPMLGLMKDAKFSQQEITMEDGDCFCCFSDGAFEIKGATGDYLDEGGLHNILESVIERQVFRVAVSKIRSTIRGIHEGVPASDDLALLLVGREKMTA